ncbi:MAG: acetyl-CoA carboxylase biotin carboxyl carrier protein [Opitutales bacterium]
MDIKEIKQVVDLMKRSDLTEFEIEEENLKLRIKRAAPHAEPVVTMPAPQMVPPPQSAAPPSPPASGAGGNPTPEPAEPKGGEVIKSPMVGTFYRAPNPDSPPFVEIGTQVTTETVVCIIEAMKVMNEIQAELKGKITEVLVENGQSVEYGQPLFRLQA